MSPSRTLRQLVLFYTLAALFAASLAAAPPRADAPFTAPRVSPLGQASQVVGVTGISVTYGRPAVRERPIWGELVPYGQVWRTGANDPTVITFSDDVTVEGKELAAGTYALFTLPEKDAWAVIFNKDHQQWGAFSYSEDDDVLRVEVRPESAAHQELFTIDFPEATAEKTVMRLRWEKLAVPVSIGASVTDEALIAKARKAARDVDNVNHLWEWTGYLMQKDVAIPEMTGWADRIAEAYPGFYSTSLKATILAKLGRTDEAIATGEKALGMGKEELGKNQFLTEQQLDKFSGTLEEWRSTRLAGTR